MSDPNDPTPGGTPPGFDVDAEPSALGAAATVPIDKGSGRTSRFSRTSKRGAPTARGRKIGFGAGTIALVVLLLALAIVPTFLSSLKKTPRDRVGISYGGGPIEGSHFQKIVEPGSRLFFNGWFDPLYLYPADQQNYIITKQSGQGAVKNPDSVIAPTKDRVQVEYQVAAYFKLNIDRLQAFHEQLGLKYNAYTAKGWSNLLQDTFRQQIESALQVETRKYTVSDLVGSAATLVAIQQQVQRSITQQLIAALGQQFFCGPTYTRGGACGPITFVIKKVDIPPSIQNAFNLIQQRKQESASIEQFNAALKAAGPDYVLLRAIESGAINFWVIPNGTGLTVQTPNGSTSGGSLTPGSGGSSSTTTTTTPSATTTTTPTGP